MRLVRVCQIAELTPLRLRPRMCGPSEGPTALRESWISGFFRTDGRPVEIAREDHDSGERGEEEQ